MWIKPSIPYFIEKHQLELSVFAEFMHCHTITEQLRTVSQEPRITQDQDEELLALKKQYTALTSPKWTSLDAQRSLEQFLQSRRRPKRLHTSHIPRNLQMTPLPVARARLSTEIRHETMRSSQSPRKPPVNFYALPETALKDKYNMDWDRRKTGRRLVSTPDNSFLVVRK